MQVAKEVNAPIYFAEEEQLLHSSSINEKGKRMSGNRSVWADAESVPHAASMELRINVRMDFMCYRYCSISFFRRAVSAAFCCSFSMRSTYCNAVFNMLTAVFL